jgi:hypothetical protein
MRSTLLTISGTALLLLACGGKPADMAVTAPTQAPAKPAVLPSALPPGHPDISTIANRNVSPAPALPPATGNLSGTVLETMNSGGYTYMKLKTPSGNIWTAVREMSVKKGATVSLNPEMTMENFESSTLHRKFDRIVFASISSPATTAVPSAMPASNPMGGAMQHMTAPPIATDVTVQKASGPDAKTIAEIWAGKDALKDKNVVIRGKVVKALSGIMGKNWIHLRDGSGDRAKGSDDITVTTDGVAKVGDVVTVSGTLRADKDFGAGYLYPVIVEDATLKQ